VVDRPGLRRPAEGRSTVADLAEAEQREESFELDLVSKTSDVITTERQLRNILGLPPAPGCA
jgi:outer membrane protein TolC